MITVLYSLPPQELGRDSSVLVALLASGTTATWTGVLTVTSEALGKVKFVPASTDFSADHSKYLVRFRVVRADAGVEYFPNGSAEVWTVRR